MSNREDYLKNEANYQDSKFTKTPREYLRKVYNDKSAECRYSHRNQMLGSVAQKRVLDLGCGDGFASMEALRKGAYVTAVDISPKSIDCLIAAARKERLECNLTAVVMDAHKLSFSDNCFDVVFGNGILHHLIDLHSALEEIKRVLKPSGYAVFMEPLGMNPILVLFRKMTPKCRTVDEQPFRMQELSMVKNTFPETEFCFFDCTTLFAKVFSLMKLGKLASTMEKYLVLLDDILLRRKSVFPFTFFQKMSWMVVLKMKKELELASTEKH